MSNMSQAMEAIEEKARSLVEALSYDVSLETQVDGDKIYLNVVGEDSDYFLTNRGEALKNVSFLLKMFQDKAFADLDLDIKFDADSYLADKEDELRSMALAAREDLATAGDEVTLEPLNPYDRRIVHMTLAEFDDVDTESLGEGHYKRLLVRKKG